MPRASPFPPIVEYDAIASRLDATIAQGRQSQVRAVDNAGVWLVKLFRPGTCHAEDGLRLEQLIALRQRLTSKDQALAGRAISWPVARLVSDDTTIGIIVPAAPKKFEVKLADLKGRGVVRPLEIDWLAVSDERCVRRGLPIPSWSGRLAVCRDLLAVGELFDRYDLVYGDWSYSNAFWTPRDYSAYVIDVDGCSFGSRPVATTPNWEDPLSRRIMDTFTDRYKLALLVARCITGIRNIAVNGNAFNVKLKHLGADRLGRLITAALTASKPTHRPSAAELLEAIESAILGVARFGNMSISEILGSGTDSTTLARSVPDDANVPTWRSIHRTRLPPTGLNNPSNHDTGEQQ